MAGAIEGRAWSPENQLRINQPTTAHRRYLAARQRCHATSAPSHPAWTCHPRLPACSVRTTESDAMAPTGPWAEVGAIIVREVKEVIPPTVFFFVGFNLILFTKRLMLSEYLIAYAGFLVATTGALIVGKVVLIADKMPFLGRFDHAPLAYPILFKAAVYTALVTVARLLEVLIHYLIKGGQLGGGKFPEEVLGNFSWSRFIAIQLWIGVLFLIYVSAHELNELLGDGELFRILFRRRSSALKEARRARIRLLTRLSRLTEANPIAVLEDPASPEHSELIAILRNLVQTDPSETLARA
jgi:hypothetical protein